MSQSWLQGFTLYAEMFGAQFILVLALVLELSSGSFIDYMYSKSNLYAFACLRWLETVSSTYILMGRYNHSLSLDAPIMVSKNCPTIGEHVFTIWH